MRDSFLNNDYVFLDGAMGTMLQKKGMELGTVPETLNILKPDWIVDIHREYIEAGADVIYANTFGANRYKISSTGYSVKELIEAAVSNAKKAIDTAENLSGRKVRIALDIGPIGKLLEPTGDLSFEEAYDIFKEEIEAAKGADVIVIETMTDLSETRAAVLAAKENSDCPVICTMTFEKNRRTFTGCSVASMCLTVEGLGVDAIGVNCSLGPKDLIPIVKEIAEWVTIPVVAKANAGLPDPVTNIYNVEPKEFALDTLSMVMEGASVVGGCCGTTPDYIRELRRVVLEYDRSLDKGKTGDLEKSCNEEYGEESLEHAGGASEIDLAKKHEIGENKSSRVPCKKIRDLAVCSATKTVVIDRPRVIGERINPTGKKRFKQALIDKDMPYIMGQAVEQAEAGAEILDVNVGLPNLDEREMMVDTVKSLMSVTNLPLQIDSTKPEVIEAALRVYTGKAIVNSVNGEDEVMENIFPVIAKYGAAVIGLTLDENGIPKKAEDRYLIAEKIVKKAKDYGIDRRNVIIDCLVMTVSAEQDMALETLKAVKMVKEGLGVKTVLGCSNISFGLPERQKVNEAFLTLALGCGLDLPITNPNNSDMMWTVKSYNVLANIDKNSMEYIDYAANHKVEKTVASSVNSSTLDKKTAVPVNNRVQAVLEAMEHGMKENVRQITGEYLDNGIEAEEIINEVMIPALDIIGDKFEKGTLFLPQLILAADVAKEGFAVIRDRMIETGKTTESKGKIIVATVKGDIHDIGKNIVKVVLENYGYEVIDLGTDVDCQVVVDEAIKHDVHLVGLSALMTTTLPSMEETVTLLRNSNADCKIMVGGAVVTPEYAKAIGADYYAKDAKESADIAKKVLG